ncbi:MAG: hypothetical protein ACOH5I_15465 [Oligoflexus sp.]
MHLDRVAEGIKALNAAHYQSKMEYSKYRPSKSRLRELEKKSIDLLIKSRELRETLMSTCRRIDAFERNLNLTSCLN